MTDPADKVNERMRREWEDRAKENARYYINVYEHEGFDFQLSGCRDAFEVLGSMHKQLREDMHIAEIGCGIGRMLPFFAMMFEQVHGVDVSPTMIEQGQARLKHLPNVTLHVGDGRTLTGIPDESLDLVVSFQVLQHIPDKEVIRDYIADSFRALRPGGYARLHVKTKPWKGAGPTPNTWDGVNVGHEDKDVWLADRPWKLDTAYDLNDGATAWVVLQKPSES